MLDIKLIRENSSLVKSRLATRQTSYDGYIDSVVSLDEKRRKILLESEQLKSEQNSINREIPRLKKEGQDISELFLKLKEMSESSKALDSSLALVEDELNSILLMIPNIPSDKVPVGKNSDDNVVVRSFGSPSNFDFEPLGHWDVGEKLGILDPATAAKVTGTRFHFYYGKGAALERAVFNFFLDHHTSKNGYTEVLPPFLVNRASMTGTGQLPKFEEDAFKLTSPDYFLIPTAEVPVTNIHRNDIVDPASLPIKYAAYSPCFRAEAGSAGRDTRGLIRQHQFNKVELVKISDPDKSYDELESLTSNACSVLEELELAYRVSLLCTGDLGFSSAITYDIEVWMPSYSRYVEISSCSNFLDYQARRASIRTRDLQTGKTKLAHTLNGSGVAVGRTVAAILENFQREDGSVYIPKALQKYTGFDLIEPK